MVTLSQYLKVNFLTFLDLEIDKTRPLRCDPLGTLNGIIKNFLLPKSRLSIFNFSIAEFMKSILFISTGGLL